MNSMYIRYEAVLILPPLIPPSFFSKKRVIVCTMHEHKGQSDTARYDLEKRKCAHG